MHISDECYKMALTDAISVACKALGVAADVYWSSDVTKYSENSQNNEESNPKGSNVYSGKQLKEAIDEVRACNSRSEINAVWKKYAAMQNNLEFKNEIQTMCKRFPK